MTPTSYPANDVLAAFQIDAATLRPHGNGLINETWLVDAAAGGGRYVLQRVNALFDPAVHHDIDVLTRHLEARGVCTCRIVPARDGALSVANSQGVWRMLTWIDGISHDALKTSRQAESAGALLARFHRAVGDVEHEFTTRRPGVHDTARHLAALRDALRAHRDHAEFARIEALGRRILAAADALPVLPVTPDRVVHGDPKVNNILFRPTGDEAICLIDLDTITRMPLPLELGDAMRSWCNPASEDDRYGEFSLSLFRDSIRGYAAVARGWILPDEWTSIVDATHTILVELAARFCADALHESYFGWNPARFKSRTEHNQVRAAGQLTVAESLVAQRAELDRIVAEAFGG